MIQCPNCGNLNYEENNFCRKCGVILPNLKICPECKYQSFIDNFCTIWESKLIFQAILIKLKSDIMRKCPKYGNRTYFYQKYLRSVFS